MSSNLQNSIIDVNTLNINTLRINETNYTTFNKANVIQELLNDIFKNNLHNHFSTFDDIEITQVLDNSGNFTGIDFQFPIPNIASNNITFINGGNTTVGQTGGKWLVQADTLSTSGPGGLGVNNEYLNFGGENYNQIYNEGYCGISNRGHSSGILWKCQSGSGSNDSIGLALTTGDDQRDAFYLMLFVGSDGGGGAQKSQGQVNIARNSSSDVTMYPFADFISQGIITSSDRRLKENIISIENALEITNKLNILQYDKFPSIDNKHMYRTREIGVIAQEIEKLNDPLLARSVIVPTNEKVPYTVNYNILYSISIKSLQELSQEYKTYKETVNKKIDFLEKKLNILENNL